MKIIELAVSLSPQKSRDSFNMWNCVARCDDGTTRVCLMTWGPDEPPEPWLVNKSLRYHRRDWTIIDPPPADISPIA